MSPCDGRGASATRRDLLAGGPIEIRPEPVELHPRSAPERGDSHLGAYESMPTQRRKLADRDAIPGHDERLALVKLTHNLAAVIAQLPLSNPFGHTTSVARVLRALHARDHLKLQAWHGQRRVRRRCPRGAGRGGLYRRRGLVVPTCVTPLLSNTFHRERRSSAR